MNGFQKTALTLAAALSLNSCWAETNAAAEHNSWEVFSLIKGGMTEKDDLNLSPETQQELDKMWVNLTVSNTLQNV